MRSFALFESEHDVVISVAHGEVGLVNLEAGSLNWVLLESDHRDWLELKHRLVLLLEGHRLGLSGA